MKIVKYGILIFVLIVSSKIGQAKEKCPQPGQVAYCGEIGTSKTFDFDSMALVRAMLANQAEITKLVADGYKVTNAKVEILPNLKTEQRQSSYITRFTITASRVHFKPLSFFVEKQEVRKLILDEIGDYSIPDLPNKTIWKSSGVLEVKEETKTQK